MYTCICVCVCVYICICICICMCIHTCICIYPNIHTYVYLYMYIYDQAGTGAGARSSAIRSARLAGLEVNEPRVQEVRDVLAHLPTRNAALKAGGGRAGEHQRQTGLRQSDTQATQARAAAGCEAGRQSRESAARRLLLPEEGRLGAARERTLHCGVSMRAACGESAFSARHTWMYIHAIAVGERGAPCIQTARRTFFEPIDVP
jgi:hypothetical protein